MLIDILARWNRWGTALLDSGTERDILKELIEVIDMDEVIALVGSRRAGKSTIMYQLMDYLESKRVDRKAILHVNFEEPSLAELLNLGLLDKIYDTYRREIYPEGKTYLFFDEIQNIPDWERWVRARNETENIKIFVTGSSSKLLSRELGTLLTGRHLLYTIYPLSFREFLRFNHISIDETTPGFTAPAKVQHALNQFLTWGSYPKVVLTESVRQKELLLKRYFEDILFKDIAMRHEIRDVNTLRSLALHLFAQTASMISFKRLARLFEVSEKLVSNYCQFIREAFLIDFLPFYSLKVAERNRNPLKVHVNDLGMRKLMSLLHAPDFGRIAETAVHRTLLIEPNQGIYYWKDLGEVDFLVRENNEVKKLVQVVYDGLEYPEVMEREVSSLEHAGKTFKSAEKILVAGNFPHGVTIPSNDINVIPFWKFLLRAQSYSSQ